MASDYEGGTYGLTSISEKLCGPKVSHGLRRPRRDALLDLVDPADLLGQERHLDDVEVLRVELVHLAQVLLLHVEPHPAMVAGRVCFREGQLRKRAGGGPLPLTGKSSWLTTMQCVSISYDVSSWMRRSVS
jgi:hypothetical protein